MRIRTRAYLLGMLPALLVAAILGIYLNVHRQADLEAALKERGGALARYVAQGAEYAVVSGNKAQMHRLLTWTAQEHDVTYVGLFRADGVLLAETGQIASRFHAPLTTGVVETGTELVFSVPVLLNPLTLEDPFLQERALAPSRTIAWARVGISRESNASVMRDMLLTTLGFIALGMVFAGMLVRGLALVGIRPLLEIIAEVRGIAAGNFRVRMPLTAKGELRELQQGINQMSETLQSFQEDMQHRVDAATAELARQKEAAERANLAKSKFLAVASHDLRQPMHAIALYVASMKSEMAGRDAAVTLGKIETAVAAMENLFSTILDVSKLDAGVVVPNLTRISVQSLLDGLHDDFHQEAEAKGLQLRLRNCPCFVESDPVLLGRILRNLIANALRYTEQGQVLVAARRRGKTVRLQVWDTGPGIPSDQIENIFQEFFQLANPHHDRSQGLGLGLAIVDRLARLLGHPLQVRSVPGKGTVFSLDVPECKEGVAPQETAGESLQDLARLHGLVAVVDDDAMVLDSLATLLQGWGLEVAMATGTEALLTQLARAPDILISDYRLGRENGLEVAYALRQAFPAEACQVVIVTGDTSPQGVRALSSSGYTVLHKPIRPARLRALLFSLLKSADGAGHA
jgi:signal transduction histidine kinase